MTPLVASRVFSMMSPMILAEEEMALHRNIWIFFLGRPGFCAVMPVVGSGGSSSFASGSTWGQDSSSVAAWLSDPWNK